MQQKHEISVLAIWLHYLVMRFRYYDNRISHYQVEGNQVV